MNLTLFILLNSASDFSLQSGLINERITFSHWHKPIAAVTPRLNHDIIVRAKSKYLRWLALNSLLLTTTIFILFSFANISFFK